MLFSYSNADNSKLSDRLMVWIKRFKKLKFLRLCAKLLFTKFPTVCRVFDFTGLGQHRDLRKYPIIVKALRKRKTLPLIQLG